MKSKKMMVSILSMSMVLGAAALPAYASTAPTEQGQTNDMVRSKDISKGSYSDSQTFLQSHKLYRNNGKYVNFWINNTGDRSITITIDGAGAREIKPGKSGHISATVGRLTGYYDFMAVQTDGNGGTMSFDYRIAQRDNQ